MTLSRGQRLALDQLQGIERESDGALSLRRAPVEPTGAGHVLVELSVTCRGLARAEGGLPLRDREAFLVAVPSDFPFVPPSLWTAHKRFAGFEHVQWGQHLCLYQAPETEWDPSDGMFGFIDRLIHWLTLGARNEFEPAGEPLHPPAVYVDVGTAGIVVPRIDTPRVSNEPWFGLAHLEQVHENRADILGWTDLFREPEATVAVDATGSVRPVAAVILLERPLPFEYPTKVSDLIAQLAERGVSRRLLLLTLLVAAVRSEKGRPLYALIGAPMRGVSGAGRAQHLAAWRMEPWVADGLRLMRNQLSDQAELREIGDQAEAILLSWADSAAIAWASVRDVRPEVTVRRDHTTPVSFFAGKVVAVWGCGALGGHAADFLARAGVRKLILRDRGAVAPGILVRQPFEDRDIGFSKTHSLAERVQRIDPRIEILERDEDLLKSPLGEDDWTEGADIVIDASASTAVLEKLELRRALSAVARAPVISIAVDHRAERGIVAVAHSPHSGAPWDVVRRVKLEACRRPELRAFADAFWPSEARHPVFQPEPGCSASTFIGSAADLAGLAAAMLNLGARDLARTLTEPPKSETATAHLLTQAHVPIPEGVARQASFAWPADVVSYDPQTGYEVRIARGAWSEIQGWIERARRTLGAEVETGGVLFGERNDACGVIWVSEVIGPPPDSSSAPEGFVCGVEGVDGANQEKRSRSRGSVTFVGMWHTHPSSAPVPSPTDLLGMAKITAAADAKTPKALLVIIGRTAGSSPAIGTFLFSREEFGRRVTIDGNQGTSRSANDGADIGTVGVTYARLCAVSRAPESLPSRKVGLALSGGGSRAIAFHLGCLRALHDRGVLEQVSVLSTVSGGSVIGALFAYGDGDFAAFEQRVVHLLRRGLVRGLARRIFRPSQLIGAAATAVTAGMTAIAADVARATIRLMTGAAGTRTPGAPHWTDRIVPPFRRRHSRTTAFEATLREELFGDLRLADPRRGGLEVVVNATELRTGTAFRFGSGASGCSRFGTVADTDTPVALAVAASAAYPAMLPALDRVVRFRRRDGSEVTERVLLTDGGVYDNLGTMCLEPGRSDDVSQHAFRPEYIIACDAGVGVIGGSSYPSWWPTRMSASFETVFRRAQNSTRDRLHRHVAAGTLRGFVFPYLGQQDQNLPWAPRDLVPRDSVAGYPTDFSPMSVEHIRLLGLRGEQLTRLLLAHYCPEL